MLATIVACIALSFATSTFATSENLFNVTRNFAFVAIVALGMMAVIVTGGIDISVGSTIGISGIVLSVVMNAGYPIWAGIGMGLLTAGLVGLVNGLLIAYLGMQPFVVTLAMLSVGRSLALVISRSRTIFDFGPDGSKLLALGGGATLGVANPVWFLILLGLLFWFAFGWTRWGRYVFAIGGNRHAATLTGVPVPPHRLFRLHALRPHGGRRGDSRSRLARRGDDRPRHGRRTARDRCYRGRRDQSDRRGWQRLRHDRRRGAHRGHPQQPDPARRRRVLAGHGRRQLHRRRGAF
ncbi:putative ABC-type sugar transport system permease subunit [Paraburkholderia sp. MM5482-R1]